MREVSVINKMKNEIDIRPTEDEKQEYLAYKTEQDFYNNLNSGIMSLKEMKIPEDGREIVLIAGAMVAFDKGIIYFLNELARRNKDKRYILLSEVTAEFRRKTDMCIEFEYICTPHLLAKEIVVPYFNVMVSKDMMKCVKGKKYLKEAVQNLEARHVNMGRGYATALIYYADLYLRELIGKVKPSLVVLWNEFYAFHSVFKHICLSQKIPVRYMEFGCIPGTVVLEADGQQGESYPARYPRKFNRLTIANEEIEQAKQVVDYIKKEQLNRNIQPSWGKTKELFFKQKAGRPIVTYMGQNDYESGMYPYTRTAKRYHSPIFESTLKGLEYLKNLAIKNDWNLVYKPHPIVDVMGSEKTTLRQLDCPVVSDVNIHELIDCSDVVITILSQVAYVSLFRQKPVVLLGYMQLHSSGAVYEAYRRDCVEKSIKRAICNGYTEEQQKNFYEHIARELKYYLYDDMAERELRYGQIIEEKFFLHL